MASLTAAFSVASTSDCSGIIITDTTTASYGGQTITGRSVNITTSNGTLTSVAFPIVTGVGDSLEYALNQDSVLTIELVLTPNTTDGNSTYTASENVLVTCNAEKYRLAKMKTNLLNMDARNTTSATLKLQEVEMISSFLDAAREFMGVGDLASAQQELDLITSYANR